MVRLWTKATELVFVLNYLHFKTLYSRRQNLDALFLINVFENKSDFCSVMDAVGLRVPTKQITDFSTLKVSNVSRLSLLRRCVTTTSANAWTFSINITSPLRIHFPLLNPTELHHCRVTCTILLSMIKL
jgi:hypothetical protein